MGSPLKTLLPALALASACQCLAPVTDCGLASCDAGPKPPPPANLHEFFERLPVDYTCAYAKGCGWAPPETSCADLAWGNHYSTLDSAQFEERIDAGAVAFDLDAGIACIAAIETRCEDGCWPPWRGLRRAGEECLTSFDCSTGLYCNGDTCPARCTPVLGNGVDTSDSRRCGTSALALLVDGGTRCLDRLPLGAECSALADETGLWRLCASGLNCGVAADGQHRFCAMPLAAGASCRGDDCGLGLECRGAPLSCVPHAKLGESCLPYGGGTQFPQCLNSLVCSGGVCKAPSTREGDACGILSFECAPPLACSSYSKTCVKLSHTGEPCADLFSCGDYRDACISGTCSRAVEPGGACTLYGDCAHALACKNGKCVRGACQ